MEKVLTTSNQKTWGGKIAAYLFLAGAGAGAYIVSFSVALLKPEFTIITNAGILLSAPLVILGVLLLILDLGKKSFAFLAFRRPRYSWISRGTIIITAFVILDIAFVVTEFRNFARPESVSNMGLVLGGISATFALLTIIYTGLVLGAAKAIAFWNPRFLTMLFLVSGISTGIAGIVLCLSVYGLTLGQTFEQELSFLARCNFPVLIIEAIIISLYLSRMSRLTQAATSVRIILKGNLSLLFWGPLVAGLIISLAFDLYVSYLSSTISTHLIILTLIVSILSLFCGFTLRYVIVASGVNLPLNVAGKLVSVPKISVSRVIQTGYRI